ncbi:MAG: hypothetical protein P8184_10845 [Calditrichia bacterium]
MDGKLKRIGQGSRKLVGMKIKNSRQKYQKTVKVNNMNYTTMRGRAQPWQAVLIVAMYTIIFAFLPLTAGNPDSLASAFTQALIRNRQDLTHFVAPAKLKLSGRLGIQYTGNPEKYLISNDIDSLSRSKIVTKQLEVTRNIELLEKSWFRLKVSVPALQMERTYYFRDSLLVSAPDYFTRDWTVIEKGFFIFHLSDPALFNSYVMERLNRFVRCMADTLEYTPEQLNRLRKNKIHYFICRNQDEIEKLSGYRARGMYYIPYDYIITTYNCHFHELVHLLVNYRLQTLPLYTLPVLQEGIAVACGGRGGRDPDVILHMGAFLQNSGLLDFRDLLSWLGFHENNASLTYPLAGLYARFLLEKMGSAAFLSLYRKYSGGEDIVSRLRIPENELPSARAWAKYLSGYSEERLILLNGYDDDDNTKPFMSSKGLVITDRGKYYGFCLKDPLLISVPENFPGYKSKLFATLFPNRQYHCEKYAVIADSNEVSVYNFFSNNLIAKYVRAFSGSRLPVSKINGLYHFAVKKTVFDEKLSGASFHP